MGFFHFMQGFLSSGTLGFHCTENNETIIDDGTTCVIEWVHIVTRAGQEERKRIAISGVAAYERGEDGLLCSIRISDYAGYEHTIDWTKTPVTEEQAKSINFVESFPAGVGRKPQS